MIYSKKLLVYFLFTTIVFLILVQIAEATSTNFTVPSGKEVTKSINLTIDDHVLIKFTVLGTTENTVYFYITYPNGTEKEFGKRSSFSYDFVCDIEGEHVLHFSNRDSSEDKFVTLDYEVQHYILGIPQMLFLTIIIVAVCMLTVATFILMGKTR